MGIKGATVEYLMTYGWAILIIIAVIGALYMMGVFQTPEEARIVEERCGRVCSRANMTLSNYDSNTCFCKMEENCIEVGNRTFCTQEMMVFNEVG